MEVMPRMVRAAEEALGREVDPEELQNILEHHALSSLRHLQSVLEVEEEDFERKGGRDVGQADYIDGLKAAIAVRKLKKDPKEWRPRKRRR